MILVVIAEDLLFHRIIVMVSDRIVDRRQWTTIAARRGEEIIPANGEDLPGETFEDLHAVLPEAHRQLHGIPEGIRMPSFSVRGRKSTLGWRIVAGSVWHGNLSGM